MHVTPEAIRRLRALETIASGISTLGEQFAETTVRLDRLEMILKEFLEPAKPTDTPEAPPEDRLKG